MPHPIHHSPQAVLATTIDHGGGLGFSSTEASGAAKARAIWEKLRTCSGEELYIQEELTVILRYQGKREQLHSLVVRGNGPSLLSYKWVEEL